MDFVDAALVRLADPTARSTVFDDAALNQLLTAAYELDPGALTGPYAATFDEVRIGVATPPRVRAEGVARAVGGSTSTEFAMDVSGLPGQAARVDALWQGTVSAHVPVTGAPVTAVRTVAPAWPSLPALDAEITATGPLPTDPLAREARRRTALVAHVATRLSGSAAYAPERADDVVRQWFTATGSETVSDLLQRGDVAEFAATLTYADPGAGGALPRTLPVSVALLVRPADVSVADLLQESKQLAVQLPELGLGRPPSTEVPARVPVVVAWVLPRSVFDDAGWPGATASDAPTANAQRRTAAGRWLAREGIGLLALPPPT